LIRRGTIWELVLDTPWLHQMDFSICCDRITPIFFSSVPDFFSYDPASTSGSLIPPPSGSQHVFHTPPPAPDTQPEEDERQYGRGHREPHPPVNVYRLQDVGTSSPDLADKANTICVRLSISMLLFLAM
jgi:hypothetical protein